MSVGFWGNQAELTFAQYSFKPEFRGERNGVELRHADAHSPLQSTPSRFKKVFQ
jgi:hypothetical protein